MVLTDAALEARPTDRGGPRAAEVMVSVRECVKVTNVDRPGVGLRAFAVELADGRAQLFATDTRTKRANWVLAFGTVIGSPKPGPWSTASSASTPSSPVARSLPKASLGSPRHRPAPADSPLKPLQSPADLLNDTSGPTRPSSQGAGSQLHRDKAAAHLPPPASPRAARSTHTRVTEESSLFGGAGEFPARTRWPSEVGEVEKGAENDVWEQLARVPGSIAPARDLFGQSARDQPAAAEPLAPLRVMRQPHSPKGSHASATARPKSESPTGSRNGSHVGDGGGAAASRRRPPPLATLRGPVPATVYRQGSSSQGDLDNEKY